MIPLASRWHSHNVPREGATVFFLFHFSSCGYFNSLKFAVLIFLYIASKTSLLEISRRRRSRAVTEKTETRKCDKCAELPWGGGWGGGGTGPKREQPASSCLLGKVKQVPKLLTMEAYLRVGKLSFRSVTAPTTWADACYGLEKVERTFRTEPPRIKLCWVTRKLEMYQCSNLHVDTTLLNFL